MNILGCTTTSLLLAMGSIVLAADGALAQPTPTGRIPTVSRLVKIFTEHEVQLETLVRERNATAAENLLTDDFELRAGPQPGRPVPRADWLSQSMESPGPDASPTQMAVHDLGGTAVVSFLRGGGKTG